MPVKDFDYNDIENLLRDMLKLGYSQTWIGNAKTVLNEAVCFAMKLEQIFQRVPEDNIYRIILVLGIYCGMRIGEILSLTWDCVDFDRKNNSD